MHFNFALPPEARYTDKGAHRLLSSPRFYFAIGLRAQILFPKTQALSSRGRSTGTRNYWMRAEEMEYPGRHRKAQNCCFLGTHTQWCWEPRHNAWSYSLLCSGESCCVGIEPHI